MGVAEQLVDLYPSSSSFDFRSLNSQPTQRNTEATTSRPLTVSPADVVLELPPLEKRPRDILESAYQRDIFATVRGFSSNSLHSQTQITDLAEMNADGQGTKRMRTDIWCAAGKQLQECNVTNETSAFPDTAILTWEMNDKATSRTSIDMGVKSLYVTEAEISIFEGVHQRHLDYAFKFRPAPGIIPHALLVDCILLLLSGTSSSIFKYIEESMTFNIVTESIRIEGCSSASVMGYGTIVAFSEASRARRVHILELYHKTRNMASILERLAMLCQCHVTQSSTLPVAHLGFTLPSGPNLLSMVFDELLQETMTSDPLWNSLLLSLLNQASRPYMEILSRWLGISSSKHSSHERGSNNQDGSRRWFGLVNHDIENAGGGEGHNAEQFRIFDCHLQQSLQGLDLYDEFFVRSRHEWSWDGSEPVMLADPLDYDGEFQMSRRIRPASFISVQLAHKVMEAGRELQMLSEYDPGHPLIVQNRERKPTSRGFEWLYLQEDIVAYNELCSELTKEVLRALVIRLEDMGWFVKSRTIPTQMKKGKQARVERPLTEEIEDMQVDRNVTESHGNLPHSRDLDPDPQKFTQVTSSLGMANDIMIACPDRMNTLLEPVTSFSGTRSGLPSISSTEIHNRTPRDPTGLQKIVSLAVLAEDGLCNAIERRTSLIHTCVLSLYFHDLNLLDHFNTMGRFLLMGDPQFTESLSQALFEGEMGLVSRAVRAFRTKDDTEVEGCRAGTVLGGPSPHGLGSAIFTAPGGMLFAEPLPWPPKSGELEMTLRAVLLDCIQYSHDGNDLFRSAVEAGNGRNVSSIEIEGGGTESSSGSIRRARRRKRLSVSELEQALAFAVRDYDDDTKIPKDINALEALDFLYLDYKPSRPLRLLFFTPLAMDKYARLFTFQLQLTRIGAALKDVYHQLRHRQRGYTSLDNPFDSPSWPHRQFQQGLCLGEMALLDRFRFEAQHIFDGLRGYIAEVAIGTNWELFVRRMSVIQMQIEGQIFSGAMESAHGQTIDLDSPVGDQGDPSKVADKPEDLKTLHNYHDRVLDQILEQALLTRKYANVMQVVYRILSSILKLSQFVDQIRSVSQCGGPDLELDEVELQEKVETRTKELRIMHQNFRSCCRELVKLLKAMSSQDSSKELMQQLLVRLDVSGFL
ncbi:hypothetical protein BGX34_011237 [Mortierella sp. NVP85]|nr:hypothetical protein BGX34_011237 [Mortierella sp. NVP85]